MSSLDLGTLHLKMKADRDGLKRDLAAAERDADQTGNRMGRNWWQTLQGWMKQIGSLFRRGGADAADGFTRDALGRLHDRHGRFVAEGKKLGEALGEGASDGARTMFRLFGQLGSAATSLSGGFGTLALVLGVLAAVMVFAIPLVYALGGALAALPAITTGGIAAIGALVIGFMGITDAFKKSSSAGASFADRAHQVALAERRLAEAQREVLDAQTALNRARKEAAERIEDLDRSLRGAELDELDATDALTAAEKQLAAAQRSKDPKRIDEATRAHKRAELALEAVRDRVDDLTQEQERSSAAGVEGSDEVTAALDRQKRATEGVEDATYDLAKAHKTAGAAGAEQATKLARSAILAVAAIKGLKRDWESLRLDVQERLFAGTDVEIKQLWKAWLPTLRERLGSMATMFNGLFKSWAKTSKNPEFVGNIAAGWLSIEQLIDKVGKAVAGPGLEAFGRLSRAAGPFLDMLGDKLAGVVEHFAAWIESAEKSGALQRFFDKATTFFGQIWDIGGDVVALLGEFFSMWTDSENGEQAVSTFDAIRMGLADLREWLKDPENRENLKNFIDGFVVLGTIAMKVLGWLVTTGIPAAWTAMEKFADAVDSVVGVAERAGNALSGMWDGVVGGAKTAFNAIAGMWNRSIGGFSFTVPEWVLGLGGKEVSFPKIPMLKDGGLVRATPGGRTVIAGEGGEDEIVSPESRMRRIVAEELARVRAEGSDPGGIRVDKLEVKAYSDRFSLSQVQRELALHGVH